MGHSHYLSRKDWNESWVLAGDRAVVTSDVNGGVDQEKDILDGEAYQLFQLRYVDAIP